MSWVDKVHKRQKINSLVAQAMKNPDFQKEYKRQLKEIEMDAFDKFLLISADYLHRHEGYSKKRMLRYIDFIVEQMGYVIEDEEYFKLMNEALYEETGVNILENLVRK